MDLARRSLRVLPIRMFEDNYAYAVGEREGNWMALIDPADFEAVMRAVRRDAEWAERTVSAVLSTHKHSDHCRDIGLWAQREPESLRVCSGVEAIKHCNKLVEDGERFFLSDTLSVDCLVVPCHTRGHVLYYVQTGNEKALFTGDTLFVGGCGKFFEGTAQEMHAALQRIGQLPGETQVYCGHEYTVSNLKWSTQVDPSNLQMRERLARAYEQRKANLPTVPSTIAEELHINIFMRSSLLAQSLGCADSISALGTLRSWKNQGQTSLL
jgi:hydroxyacylglutathione hydrolase